MLTLTLHNEAFARAVEPIVRSRILTLTDVHTADQIGRLAGESELDVLLGLALAVAAPASGHTGVSLLPVLRQLQALKQELQKQRLVQPGTVEAMQLPQSLEGWLQKLLDSPLVGAHVSDATPLVWQGGLLQTHRMASYEARLAAGLRARARQLPLTVAQQVAVQHALTRLAGSYPRVAAQEHAAVVAAVSALTVISGGPGTGKTSTVRKLLLALRAAFGVEHLRVALAAPTGKAAARMREALLQQSQSGSSDGVETEERDWVSGLQAVTLHRLLGFQPRTPSRPRHHADNPLPFHVIVVDEASMLDVALLCKLIEATPAEARLVLLGDRHQLASVDAGSVLADLTQLPPERRGMGPELLRAVANVLNARAPQVAPVELPAAAEMPDPLAERMLRFDKAFRFEHAELGGVIAGLGAASDADEHSPLLDAEVERVLGLLQAPDSAVVSLVPHEAVAGGMGCCAAVLDQAAGDYAGAVAAVVRVPENHAADDGRVEREARALQAVESIRVLAAHREGALGVAGLNEDLSDRVQRALGLFGRVTHERWWPGRLILITENDYENQLWNGDVGIVVPNLAGVSGDAADVVFAGPDGPRRIAAAALPAHETAFAMTIHKSQGSQFGHVVVVLPAHDSRLLSRELIYTAMSRARRKLTVCGDVDLLRVALRRRVERATALGTQLWGDD